jgi:hypothetical protein
MFAAMPARRATALTVLLTIVRLAAWYSSRCPELSSESQLPQSPLGLAHAKLVAALEQAP